MSPPPSISSQERKETENQESACSSSNAENDNDIYM